MGTVFYYTLRESLARRMGVVFLGLCVVIPTFYIWNLQLETGSDGKIMAGLGRTTAPLEIFIRMNWNAQFVMANQTWCLLALFLAAPLLSSYLEKGWADLLLTKKVPRWQLLIERLAATTFIFVLMLFLIHGIPAIYLWARAGVDPARFFAAFGILAFSFLTIAVMMALVAVPQPNVALLVMVGFLQIAFSRLLADREQIIKLFDLPWLKPPLDLLYTILPRTKEVADIALDVLNRQTPASWAPLWWSIALTIAYTVLACYTLHRKAI